MCLLSSFCGGKLWEPPHCQDSGFAKGSRCWRRGRCRAIVVGGGVARRPAHGMRSPPLSQIV